MTAKTPKDVTEDAEETSAAEVEATDEETAASARPAKRKRRVRVIEVIDDDDEDTDLEDVLKTLDEEEKPAPRRKAAPKPVVDEDEEEEEEAPKKRASARRAPVNVDENPSGSSFGMTRNAAIVAIVLIAALASVAIWQWTSASGLASTADDRKAVEKVATDYGNVAINYNASNYTAQMDKAQKLMAGDLLENFKQCTLPNLGTTFKEQPELALTSKTTQTFVGSVDSRFATATIAVDVGVRSKSGNTDVPSNLVRLSLSKVGGTWKVTQQFASGNNVQKRGCDDGGLSVPGGTGTDKGTEKEKKKN